MATITARFGLTFKAKARVEFDRVVEPLKEMDIISIVEYQPRSVRRRDISFCLELTGEKKHVDAVREWMLKFARNIGQSSYN